MEKEFIGALPGYFTDDSQHAILKSNDTLLFFLLGTEKSTYVTNINTFKQPKKGNDKWIAYQLKK